MFKKTDDLVREGVPNWKALKNPVVLTPADLRYFFRCRDIVRIRWGKKCYQRTNRLGDSRSSINIITQIQMYTNTQEQFLTFPHFQGWRLQDRLPAAASTCFAGFGTKSSPEFHPWWLFIWQRWPLDCFKKKINQTWVSVRWSEAARPARSELGGNV